MHLIDGSLIANKVFRELRSCPRPDKQLSVIVPGDVDFSNEGFLNEILDAASMLGIPVKINYKHVFYQTEELAEDVRKTCVEDAVGGFLLTLPLPKHIDRGAVLRTIPLGKDVDCLNPDNTVVVSPAVLTLARIFQGVMPEFSSRGKSRKIAVVGRGLLVGRPAADFLARLGHQLEIFHSQSSLDRLKDADVVILGTGIPKLVSPEQLLAGAAVIDFGYPGDLDRDHPDAEKISWYVPSRGGTGPILVACMFENFYRLNGLIR